MAHVDGGGEPLRKHYKYLQFPWLKSSLDWIYDFQLASTNNKASSQKPEFLIASYPGTGAVYNMVVKVTTPAGVTMAAYFPQVTYSCNLQQRDSCHMYGM